MDIYDRLLMIEQDISDLKNQLKILTDKLNSTEVGVRPPREPKKTQYLPAVTEDLAFISSLDPRSEDTVIAKKNPRSTDPKLRAAISAVSRAVELSKEAENLVEEVNHLARQLMGRDDGELDEK